MKNLTSLAIVAFLSMPVFAQEPKTTATTSSENAVQTVTQLTDVQKLQVLNAAKDVQILDMQLAKAREVLQQLLTSVTPAGYQLNDKLELVKVEKPK